MSSLHTQCRRIVSVRLHVLSPMICTERVIRIIHTHSLTHGLSCRACITCFPSTIHIFQNAICTGTDQMIQTAICPTCNFYPLLIQSGCVQWLARGGDTYMNGGRTQVDENMCLYAERPALKNGDYDEVPGSITRTYVPKVVTLYQGSG